MKKPVCKVPEDCTDGIAAAGGPPAAADQEPSRAGAAPPPSGPPEDSAGMSDAVFRVALGLSTDGKREADGPLIHAHGSCLLGGRCEKSHGPSNPFMTAARIVMGGGPFHEPLETAMQEPERRGFVRRDMLTIEQALAHCLSEGRVVSRKALRRAQLNGDLTRYNDTSQGPKAGRPRVLVSREQLEAWLSNSAHSPRTCRPGTTSATFSTASMTALRATSTVARRWLWTRRK